MVELDFLYPSEGIHMRWENGYRITSTAATQDQAAFILSIPRRKPADETQETLRTSAFPSTHVKVHIFQPCNVLPFFTSQHLFSVFHFSFLLFAGEVVKESLYCFYLLWSDSFMSY